MNSWVETEDSTMLISYSKHLKKHRNEKFKLQTKTKHKKGDLNSLPLPSQRAIQIWSPLKSISLH